MNVPEEAVQAVHAAICEQRLDDCMDPDWRGRCVKAVEAAAPAIRAQALEDAADKVVGPSDVLLDAATCRWIAMEVRERAADWRRIPLRPCQECPKLVPADQERCNHHECQDPIEYVIRDSSGRVLDRWIETDEDL